VRRDIKLFTSVALAALGLMASCTSSGSPFTPPQVLPLAKTIKLPRTPVAFARAGNSMWVIANNARGPSALFRVPAHSDYFQGRPQRLPLRASTQTVMMGQGADLWIAIGRPPGSHGGRRGGVIKLDKATSKLHSRTPIPATPTAITVINEAVWIASAGTKLGHGKLLRVDPSTGDVTHTVTGLDLPDVIASGPTALWASGVNGDLWRIDPKSYKVKRYAGYRHLEAITATAMWTIAHGVQQRDPTTAKLVGQSSPTECQPSFVVAAESRVWAVSCVKVGPDPQPEGPPQIAPMLFA
jgi:hypothetical protein